ncbi:MAG: SpoVA/SpoVAEb family sporulation membrane protein [Clostridiales bacterium]|jgi:stage V sporulation protein AE|nr:SpoVA/SpoVAEb family sporulation membrane protein [Clostridiales bacterium]
MFSEYLIEYLKVFAVGGAICLIGQILINHTKITTSRILVFFMLLGGLFEILGLYKYLVEFGGSGATVPISGFGSVLVKGAFEAVEEFGVIGIITGGMSGAAMGISAAILFGFIFALIFKARTKEK